MCSGWLIPGRAADWELRRKSPKQVTGFSEGPRGRCVYWFAEPFPRVEAHPPEPVLGQVEGSEWTFPSPSHLAEGSSASESPNFSGNGQDGGTLSDLFVQTRTFLMKED